MEKLEFKKSIGGRRNFRINNKEQELADRIYSWSNKRIPFGAIMNFIGKSGTKKYRYQFVYETWNGLRDSNAKDPVAIFMSKMGNEKNN